jgi:hypothetical protein
MKSTNTSMQDQQGSDPKFFYFVLAFIIVLVTGAAVIAFRF